MISAIIFLITTPPHPPYIPPPRPPLRLPLPESGPTSAECLFGNFPSATCTIKVLFLDIYEAFRACTLDRLGGGGREGRVRCIDPAYTQHTAHTHTHTHTHTAHSPQLYSLIQGEVTWTFQKL